MTKPIIALDFASRELALEFLDRFEEALYVKVGMELYYQCGPQIIADIKARGHQIFLDLKLHDIPNTVQSAMRRLAGLGVDMTNVHCAGGLAMMKAARQGLDEGSTGVRTLLIGVTQLTSTSEAAMNLEQGIPGSLLDSVVRYAQLAQRAGLDGVVCSPLESAMIHERVGQDFLTVTPGIRPREAAVGDQKRVTTPRDARQLGSNYIVVGRPITAAADPVLAYHQIEEEFNS